MLFVFMFMESNILKSISEKYNIDNSDVEERLQKECIENAEYFVPVVEICEKIGLDVVFEDLEDAKSGYIDIDEKKIYINKNHSGQRMRFTIAHELGHYILHKDKKKESMENLSEKKLHNRFDDSGRYSQEELEWEYEANDFAAELLMPKNLFIVKYTEFGKNIIKVANFFVVSSKAAEIRAWRLGLNYSF